MISNTSLAILPEMVPSSIRPSSLLRWAAEMGLSAIVRPALLSAPNRSFVTQLAAFFGSLAAATASKYSALSRSATRADASLADRPMSSMKRCFLASGSSGRVLRRPSMNASVNSSGSRSGSGK